MTTVREAFGLGFQYDQMILCRTNRFIQVKLYQLDNLYITGKRHQLRLLSLLAITQKNVTGSFSCWPDIDCKNKENISDGLTLHCIKIL